MPAKKKSPASLKKNKKATKKCAYCPQSKIEHPISDFYLSKNPFHTDGRIPMCKNCIAELCIADDGEIDLKAFKQVLQQCDKPWIESLWLSSVDEYNSKIKAGKVTINTKLKAIGCYFKNLNSLPQYKSWGWNDGIVNKSQGEKRKENRKRVNAHVDYIPDDERIYYLDEDLEHFEVTDEIVKLFGGGFKKKEYKAMSDKFDFLSQSYNNITNLHTEALVNYVRLKVKEEMAIVENDYNAADKWAVQAEKAAARAKINPNQLTKSDLTGGLNTFSELIMAVEQASDIIEILPEFRARPHDTIDFAIYCYVNYCRRLEGKPEISYEDVYSYYDRMKDDLVKNNRKLAEVLARDGSKDNREAVEEFIEVPPDYYDEGEGS